VITGLRFVERSIPAPEMGENITRTVRILQQHMEQHGWVDVPLVIDKPKDDQ